MTDTQQLPTPQLVQLGDLTIDLDDYRIHYPDGTTMRLTGQEQMFLKTLIEAGGRLVTMEHLGRQVWGWERGYPASAIWHCVFTLRQKLRDDRARQGYIQTVHRLGYRFRLPPTTEISGQSRNGREVIEGTEPASEPARDPAPEPPAAPRRKERANGRRKR